MELCNYNTDFIFLSACAVENGTARVSVYVRVICAASFLPASVFIQKKMLAETQVE